MAQVAVAAAMLQAAGVAANGADTAQLTASAWDRKGIVPCAIQRCVPIHFQWTSYSSEPGSAELLGSL